MGSTAFTCTVMDFRKLKSVSVLGLTVNYIPAIRNLRRTILWSAKSILWPSKVFFSTRLRSRSSWTSPSEGKFRKEKLVGGRS
jgi:hypothetical protein